MTDDGTRSRDNGAESPPATGGARRPRTGGEVARLGPVQVALALLVFLFALLGLWLVWPLLTGGA